MPGRLQDKVAIVTGAGSVGPGWGNGRATAVRFAQEGAKIFAVDRNLDATAETVERVKAAGGEIVVHACDVTNSQSVAAMVAACLERFGRIDVLVNNAGIFKSADLRTAGRSRCRKRSGTPRSTSTSRACSSRSSTSSR